ncbi:MAG: hypothetical protein ABW252_17115 [Polyangiales bacterium]
MPDANVVDARFDALRAQWTEFVERAPARLLVWRADADERELVVAFIDVECDAESAQTADLFLQLTSPFIDAETHGRTLATELLAQYAKATADAPDDARWTVEATRAGEDDVGMLLRVLASFHAHHGDDAGQAKLGVWLDPGEVESWDAYLSWLRHVLVRAPDVARMIAVEVDEASYQPLAAVEPARVATVACALQVQAMFEALAAAPGDATPADRYRLLTVQLGDPGASLARARALGAEATEIGLTLGQPALAAVAQALLAAACSHHEQPDEALRCFASAEQYGAQQAVVEGEDVGAKLRLMAMLGAAAVQLGARAHDAAARTYVEAAQLAREASDVCAEMDAHRLASFCLALAGAPTVAWEVGMRGLASGLAHGEAVRCAPAVLRLAAQLQQLTRAHRTLRDHARPLDTQLTRALGAGWQDGLAGAAG